VRSSCQLLGYARSSYYKQAKQIQEEMFSNGKVLDQIRFIRQEMPKVGGRKLHYLLRQALLGSGVRELGRDRLFDLLRENDLLVKRRKRYAITTNSNHPFKVYKNLIIKEITTHTNQVWVSDITYVRTRQGFSYLSLVTDLYSRKIIGYHASESLELLGCVKALKMALKSGKPKIHHSDRGSQYCSHQYTRMLKKHKVQISMTENGNCYENAVAERINGILKEEFNLNATFRDLKHVRKAVEQAIKVYNAKRPNWALNLKTPDQVYLVA
jgi:transposase InsO family protein